MVPNECLKSLHRREVFAFDFETCPKAGFEHIPGASLHPRSAYVEWISVATSDGAWDWPVSETESPLKGLEYFFRDKTKTAVAFNFAFEMKFILAYCDWRIPLCQKFDPMIAKYLVNPTLHRYSLESFGKKVCSYEEALTYRGSLYPEYRKKWNEYCQADSRGALELWEESRQELEALDLLTVFEKIEMPMMVMIAEMETLGINADTKKLLEEKKRIYDYRTRTGELVDTEQAIYKACGGEFPIGSGPQLSRMLFDGNPPLLPITYTWKSKEGFYVTPKEVLHDYSRAGFKVADLILKRRQIQKDLTATWEPLIRTIKHTGGRFFPQCRQIAQKNSRWSYTQPSINTVFPQPEKSQARKALIASKGMVLIGGDEAQVELRLMAHCANDPALIQIFLDDLDFYQHIANSLEIPRKIAKVIVLGTQYRMGAKKLQDNLHQQGIEMNEQECKLYLRSYYKQFPGIKQFHARIEHQVMTRGYVLTLAGRRRDFSEDIKNTDEDGHYPIITQAINSVIQGSAADLIKMALRDIKKETWRRGLWGPKKFHTLFQLHDEIIAEAPVEIAEECREIMETVMTSVWKGKLRVPLKAEVKIGHSWYDLSKK